MSVPMSGLSVPAATAASAQPLSTSELDRAWLAVESRLALLGEQLDAVRLARLSLDGAASPDDRLKLHDMVVANCVEVESRTQELVALSDSFSRLARQLDVAANWHTGAAERERERERVGRSPSDEGNYCRALHALRALGLGPRQ